MDSVSDDAKGIGYRRVEVLTGPGRRRQWSDDDKARVIAETMQLGVTVTEVARRWQISPQQVFDWRRLARRATLASKVPVFVPIVSEASACSSEPPTVAARDTPTI
ncbi:transposase [Belnapia sp. T18]|uniref:Transposase n=1 Tax=Belnapia arida TaxID=2804533 RepID=A0ABS1UBV9_9PROT|nr:transposase [Belnapia arida]MBL6082176.1 transposase [Belnapia arida]